MPRDALSTELEDNIVGMLTYKCSGDFKKTLSFLEAIRERRMYKILDSIGQKGVAELSAATPRRTGTTASSWSYRVTVTETMAKVEWLNSNKGSDGVTPVAILIQYGHGTRNGGYVPPNDYINPIMQPLFDEATEKLSKVVRMS